jgi:hypothetical protein
MTTTYGYQVECSGDGVPPWATYREFDSLEALNEFSRTEEARLLCWGRAFRFVGPAGEVIDHLATFARLG